MYHKPFDKIEKQDIDDLSANSVPEGKTIEYKQELPGNRDSDKKEFLYVAKIGAFNV